MKLDILCPFPTIIKAICVAGMFMDSQDCSIWYWMLPEERKKSRSLPQSDYPSYGNAVAMYFQDNKEFSSFLLQNAANLLQKEMVASSVGNDRALSPRVSKITNSL